MSSITWWTIIDVAVIFSIAFVSVFILKLLCSYRIKLCINFTGEIFLLSLCILQEGWKSWFSWPLSYSHASICFDNYTPYHISLFSNSWKPKHQNLLLHLQAIPNYLEKCKFLPKLNNELPDERNSTYKERFTSLQNLVLIMVKSSFLFFSFLNRLIMASWWGLFPFSDILGPLRFL